MNRIKQNKIENEYLDWETSQIIDAPIGTMVSMNDSIIHAGPGANSNDIRIVLSWKWTKIGLENYGTVML